MIANPAALAAALKGDIANALIASTPGGIEAQEAAGQAALVSARDRLPRLIRPNSADRESLERAWGVKFGNDVDELFVAVTLPDGWTIKASEHSMHSTLLDADGAERAHIFYKAAFYDRRADMRVNCRYQAETEYGDYSADSAISTFAKDRKTGKTIQEFGSCVRDDWDTRDRMELAAEEWLLANYPKHRDPLAYWSE